MGLLQRGRRTGVEQLKLAINLYNVSAQHARQSAALAVINPSACPSVCPSVTGYSIESKTQNDSCYDYGVFSEDSTMTLVSSWLTSV